MIGQKKLSEIRRALKQAIERESEDPLRWLEERIASTERGENEESAEVLASLRRFLSEPRKGKPRKPRAKAAP